MNVMLCVLVVALLRGAMGELPPPEKSYKILMLLPMSSKSHRNVFLPVAEALADRGHKIVMLTNHPKVTKHSNIYEFDHGLQEFNEENINVFEYLTDPTGGFSSFVDILPQAARKLYDIPKVQDLYNKRKDFDVILIDHLFNELAYPFVHEKPFITVATGGMDPRQSAVLGNVLPTSYTSALLVDYPLPMTMWQRFLNTLAHIGLAVYWRDWAIIPVVQKEISLRFPDLPPLMEMERNQSLVLMNSHFSVSTNVPLLPSQVEVGAMHCRPAKPLPEDLESWISGAGPEGVIYFCLGSVTQGKSMPLEFLEVFIEVFRRLPQRIIWKYEGELENVPENVMISKWLPQQDILGKDKVKVFISHGGLLGTQEGIYHATPILVMPIFGDQYRNGMFVKTSDLGDMLLWKDLTVETLLNALTELTTNQRYQENIARVSSHLRDQPETPTERAVFWTEYVIRHHGAPQLRSPAAQLSWVEYLMLDVLFFINVALFIIVFIMRRIFRGIKNKLFSSNDTKKKRD